MSKLFIIVSCCFFILMLQMHECYSSEENHGDDELPSPRPHSPGHGESPPSHSSSSKSHHSHRHNVNLPSGAVLKISDPAIGATSTKKCEKPTLISLNPSGKVGRKEYPIIAQEMEITNEKDEKFVITKIQKIVNACAWRAYTYKRSQIKGESGDANETILFYGSTRTKELVVNGFGPTYVSNGNLGEGFYFTEHSAKAHKFTGASGQLLLCRVTLGNVKSFGFRRWRSGHPPVGYNSVRYVTRSGYSPYLVVYSGDQIYPEYLITYTVQTESDSGQNSDENYDD